jgi:hypothetical protein
MRRARAVLTACLVALCGFGLLGACPRRGPSSRGRRKRDELSRTLRRGLWRWPGLPVRHLHARVFGRPRLRSAGGGRLLCR